MSYLCEGNTATCSTAMVAPDGASNGIDASVPSKGSKRLPWACGTLKSVASGNVGAEPS